MWLWHNEYHRLTTMGSLLQIRVSNMDLVLIDIT